MKLPDFGDLNIIYLTIYGSHLYGTSIEGKSDYDLKGVFLPTAEQILLGKVPKSVSFNTKTSDRGDKNGPDDVDCEIYSYSYFLDLAFQGQTVALELLWSSSPGSVGPLGNILIYSYYEWEQLTYLRDIFITKNMKSFLGYARGQAIRYSLKGDKLNTLTGVRDHIKGTMDIYMRSKYHMKNIWENLRSFTKDDKNVKFIESEPTFNPDSNDIRMIEICGRKIMETVSIEYALDVIDGVIANYGKRAKESAHADGVDYKALSHAIRIAEELKSMYTVGELVFPIPNVEHIRDIKAGNFPVKEITEELERIADEIEVLSNESNYPDKANRKVVDDLIINTYKKIVLDM